MMRKLGLTLISWCLILTGFTDAKTICIIKSADHAALDSVKKGIKDQLGEKRVKYKIESCQGNSLLAVQIISKYVSNKADIIVAIGTMPAQVAFKLAKAGKTKLVFSSVTDPSSISSSLKNTNTTGVSNFVPLEPQIVLIKKIQPEIKKLGIIYNTGELNSVVIVNKIKKIAPRFKIELTEQCVTKSSEIPQAINALAPKVDAVFISNDNTALANMPCIVNACNKRKIPVYVSDTDQVKEAGCLAACGPNQYAIGKQTGKMIEKIIDGQGIDAIPVEYPDKTETYVNVGVAKKLGIKIPNEILKKAEIAG